MMTDFRLIDTLTAGTQPGTAMEHRCARVRSVDVHYSVVGSGEPLILLHGLSGSMRWWARNVAPLATHFRVYLIDLLGFGHSRGQRFVLHEASALLLAWMDQLHIDRASVIGHSMGGFIAADLTVTAPARIQRLVLVDAAALATDRTYLQHTVGLMRGLWSLPVSFWPVLLVDALRAGPVTICRAAHEIVTANINAKLPHIHTPTLVIWGEHDWVIPLADGAALCRHLPHAELTIIKKAGHVPMWDRPEPFNRTVIDFLVDAPSCREQTE